LWRSVRWVFMDTVTRKLSVSFRRFLRAPLQRYGLLSLIFNNNVAEAYANPVSLANRAEEVV
jgi:hypothetical protein